MGNMLRFGRALTVGAWLAAGASTSACSSSGNGGTADAGPATCTAGGTPTMHTTSVTGDEVWAAGIHVVPSSLTVTSGGHLTIAPCADVRLGAAASITVTTSAVGLDAVGTAAQPITFERDGATAWGAIDVTAPATARFEYATLSGGGTGAHDAAPTGGATIATHGSDPERPILLDLRHTTITGSGGLGIFLRASRFDPASTDLTITQSGWYPLYTGVGSVTEIPSGTYTGNAIDQILLQSFNTAAYVDQGALLSDVTMSSHGVPYRVGTVPSSIVVGDGSPTSPTASLTIQAGVTLLFTPEGTGAVSQLLVNAANNAGVAQAQGALIVAGTAAAPVIFESAGATPIAGDWQGLLFAGLVDPRSSVAHAEIRHAGGYSSYVGICPSTPAGNNGVATCAVIIHTQAAPSPFLSGSLVSDAPCGVYRGWSTSDIDFASINQFTTVTGCTETSIAHSNGSCDACPTAP